MTESEKMRCHGIITGAASLCAVVGAGLAQLPTSDSLVIVPIQIGMIVSLGGVFGVELSDSKAKSVLATAAATTVGRGISQVLVGWIPTYGNVVNATTAFAVTQTIGWVVVNEFANSRVLPYDDMQKLSLN